ncbi:MAG: carboxypeptidase regulatory-like domain-containing protein [Firmicutes bacterium]|nr:carboxypeptidase regulatory-like domain-containing protein [Bacillota bacterium]
MKKKHNVLMISLLLVSLVLTGCLSVKGLSRRNLSISGIVVDGDGNPVGGAQIIIASTVVATTVSDGKWYFSGAHKGDKVEAFKEGFNFIPEENEVKMDGQELYFTAIARTSTDYKVSGRVVDNAGRGIPSVTVIFAGGKTVTAITNSQGEFTKTGLSGSVKVSAAKDGYTFTGPDIVEGPADEVVFVGTVETSAGYPISGRVVDSKNAPIANAIILLTDVQDGVIRTTTSDSDGFFSIADLVGKYAITISKKGWEFTPESHYVDRTATNINFYGTPDIEATYAISGRILIDGGSDDGKGLAAVNIIIEFQDYPDVEIKHTITDSSGEWKMDGLVGAIRVTPLKNGYSFTPTYQIADKAVTTIGFTAKPAP